MLDPLKRSSLAAAPIVAAGLLCCARGALPESPAAVATTAPSSRPADAADAALPDVGVATVEAGDADDAAVFDDPMELHHESPDALRALMGDAADLPLPVGGGPWRLGQGNRAISKHAIGRRTCMRNLADVTIQTPEQRERCGAENMVPIWERGGSMASASFCIDVFEFPDKPCELPFVFVTPAQADRICRAQGKRLCTQDEWNLACRGDPNGGADRVYAYGDDLDLQVCNTDKSRRNGPYCDVSSTEKLWTTCGTDTEPSGAFPRCRSRFGVFDQHGNVAEIMTRFELADREVKTQLKGSAFFYVDVAKRPQDPGGYWTKYPDHCNFDPRWHVEKLETSQHMNYHLGFRCCRSLSMLAAEPFPGQDHERRADAREDRLDGVADLGRVADLDGRDDVVGEDRP
ncbi:MAG TPA: SUMF1/EgtB/PvdO family nonheme iron enzyme [Polyangiaceae bacterium]